LGGRCGRWYVPSETVSEWAVGSQWGLTQTQHRGGSLCLARVAPVPIGRGVFFCRTPRIRRPNRSGQDAAEIPSLDAKQELLLLLLLLHETYSSYVAKIRTTGRITLMKSFPPARSCAAWILHLSCRPASVSLKRKSRRLGR
jgi:hypothetical protein